MASRVGNDRSRAGRQTRGDCRSVARREALAIMVVGGLCGAGRYGCRGCAREREWGGRR